MQTNRVTVTQDVITDAEIRNVLSLRQVASFRKKQLELVEDALNQAEQEVMARLEAGAKVDSDCEVLIKSTERRNVSWKNVAIETLGAEAVDQILESTDPTISYKLLIRE